MDDVLDDVPYGNGHCRQHKQAANEDELIIALEAIFNGVNDEQRHHDDGENNIGDDEQRAYPDAPLLKEASHVQATHPVHWSPAWDCNCSWESGHRTTEFPDCVGSLTLPPPPRCSVFTWLSDSLRFAPTRSSPPEVIT